MKNEKLLELCKELFPDLITHCEREIKTGESDFEGSDEAETFYADTGEYLKDLVKEALQS